MRYNKEELKNNREVNGNRDYQCCTIGVMDTISDPDITFDEKGVSNYYHNFVANEAKHVKKGDEGLKHFDEIVAKIKKDGKGHQYDCILGVSGGVDSSYLAYIASQQNLKVLCIHFDNGWNSELAVKNIENIVNKCGFDLYTYVIDWPEFRDIQRAYIKANVLDIEAVTDIAIFSALDQLTKKFRVNHIIDGRNVVTEATLAPSWTCKNTSNLRDIHSKFGEVPLRSYPILSPIKRRIEHRRSKITSWPLLNYIPYNKKEAKETIIKELEWRDYGGKHYESVFTRFYQGYILPEKFFIDKRKAHLSDLIFSGQITKDEALAELDQPIYPESLLKSDYEFVIKKLGFTDKEFQDYIKAPGVPHDNFNLSNSIFDEVSWLKPFQKLFRK